MRKYTFCLALLVITGAVSCSKMTSEGNNSRRAMEISPESSTTARTKSIAEGGPLKDDYTIYLSAFFHNQSLTGFDSNYLTAEPFEKNESGTWSATPTVFWPLGGYLDLLAIAADPEDLNVKKAAKWYEDDVTRGVEIDIKDWDCLHSELLYSAATSKKDENRCVSMVFQHAQSWLQFNIDSLKPNTIRIDSVVIKDAYVGGLFRINNGVFLDGSWDFRGHFRKDYNVTELQNYEFTSTRKSVNILLPEQQACDIVVYYRQKSSLESSWDNYTKKTSYTCKASGNPWFSGTKSIFNIGVSAEVMTLSTKMTQWDNDIQNITVK